MEIENQREHFMKKYRDPANGEGEFACSELKEILLCKQHLPGGQQGSLPCALLHNRADVLTNQGQELLRVS